MDVFEVVVPWAIMGGVAVLAVLSFRDARRRRRQVARLTPAQRRVRERREAAIRARRGAADDDTRHERGWGTPSNDGP